MPAHLPFTWVSDVCVHTSLMLLLLPQDLVPLKQGLWFDRLPVLGLQSNRPVGMVVLLSTCSWLMCVSVHVLCLWTCFVLCCWDFPIFIVRTQGGTSLSDEKQQLVFVWGSALHKVCSGKYKKFQIGLWFSSFATGLIEIYVVCNRLRKNVLKSHMPYIPLLTSQCEPHV